MPITKKNYNLADKNNEKKVGKRHKLQPKMNLYCKFHPNRTM